MGARYACDVNSEGHIEKLIEDAISSGELTPTRGVGEPFKNLDRDPMWWVGSLLRRERAALGLGEISSYRDGQLDRAISADSLSEARNILASLNTCLAEWNETADDEHQLDIRDEIWLLTERENARR